MQSRMLLPVLLTISAAGGCASAGLEARTGACDVFVPIRPGAADVGAISDELVRQLLVHNETGEALCGWRAQAEAVGRNGV
jgi:hypothetical protein